MSEKGIQENTVMWDSIQRVKTALEHHEPDRVPLDIGGTRVSGIHVKAYRAYRGQLGLPPSDPEWQVRYLQLPRLDEDFRSLLGVDLESVDPITAKEESPIEKDETGHFYTDRWGTKWFMPHTSAYYDVRTFPLADVESVADLDRYRWPNEASPAILDNLEAGARKVWFEHRRPVFLGRTCPGIFEMPGILCGHEKAWTNMATNPALAEALLDRFLELKLIYYQAAIQRVLAAGVEYFIIGESDDLGGQKGPLISPEMYRRMVKPRHTQLFKAIKEYSHGCAFVELHSDGAITKLLPDLIETGIDILNPIQVSAAGMDDTRALKRVFGDAIVFHGGVVDSQYTLPHGTPQEVKDEVRRRMDDLAPGGGFIFTPVHSIQHDVPFENFMAMLETYREYAG